MKQYGLTAALFVLSLFVCFVIGEIIVRCCTSFDYTAPRIFSESDFIPWELKPNTRAIHEGYFGDFRASIEINSMGYRDKEFTPVKPTEVFRILVLGDSFTFGEGVENQEAYPKVLERLLNSGKEGANQRYQVINAGYASGYAPDTAFAYFRNKGIHLNPDVTLLGYFEGNDLFEVLHTQWPEVDLHGLPLRVTTDMYYIDSLGRLRMAAWLGLWSGVAKSPVSPLLHLKVFLRDHSQLLNFVMQKYRLFLIARSKRSTNLDDAASGDNQTRNAAYEPAYRKIDRVLKGLQALANQVGSRFIVVSIPTRGHEREGHGFIRSWCERNRVPLIDLDKDFAQAESKNMYFTIDPHWNAQGHAHAAQAIYEYLSRAIFHQQFQPLR